MKKTEVKKTEVKRCKQRVYSGSFTGHQCQNRATVGDYCKIHDPVRLKARRDEQNAKWDAEWKRRKEAEEARIAAAEAKADLERRTVAMLERLIDRLPEQSSFPKKCKPDGVTRDEASVLLAEWKALTEQKIKDEEEECL